MQSTQWFGAVVLWLFLFTCIPLCFTPAQAAGHTLGESLHQKERKE